MQNVATTANNIGASFFSFLENTSNILVENIKLLATQAGFLLEHLWLIITRQQIVLGLQEFVTGLGLLVAAGFSYNIFRKTSRKEKMNHTDKRVVQVFTFLVFLALAYNGFKLCVSSMPRLINPEYYALQESVKLIREVKGP